MESIRQHLLKRIASQGLWRDPDFLRLWTGLTVSAVGSGVTAVALPLVAVLMLQATPVELGLLRALGSLPAVLLGLFVGVWVDRWPRRPILLVSDLGRAVALASIPVAAAIGFISMPYLWIVGAVTSTLSVFSGTALVAFVPSLIGKDHVIEANGKLEVGASASQIVGPSFAGILVQYLSAPFAILVDAASFGFSFVMVFLIRRRPEPKPSATQKSSVLADVRIGLGLVWGTPILRSLALTAGSVNFFSSWSVVVFLLYLPRDLGINPGLFGGLFSIASVSGLVGAVFAARIAQRYGLGATLLTVILLEGLGYFLVPIAGGPFGLLVAALVLAQVLKGLSAPIFNISLVSLRQMTTPLELQGRVNATARVIAGAAVPVGSLVGGSLGELVGPRATLFLGAAGVCLASLWILSARTHLFRTAPATAPADLTRAR